jgi:hypothetical protein
MHLIKEEDNTAKVSVIALKSLISEADAIFETMADLEDNHDKAVEAYDGQKLLKLVETVAEEILGRPLLKPRKNMENEVGNNNSTDAGNVGKNTTNCNGDSEQ